MFVRNQRNISPRTWVAGAACILSILACSVQVADTTPTAPPAGTICDDAAFVTDVTVPDGTTVKAGQSFTKTWRLRNAGTCAWSAGYRLAFVGGEALGGSSILLGKAVPPNGQTDISVTLKAPAANGTFKGDWRMHNASNVAFGSTVYVVITVSDAGGPAATATASANGCPSGQFRVSGNLNVTDGVSFAFTAATSTPAVIFVEQGYYFCVPSDWTGTWTPSKGAAGNWSFSPANYSATVTTDLSGYHFVATPLVATTPAE